MPDDTQIDLGQTVAELRPELDARTAERDDALAREAAMAKVLQIINSPTGGLARCLTECWKG